MKGMILEAIRVQEQLAQIRDPQEREAVAELYHKMMGVVFNRMNLFLCRYMGSMALGAVALTLIFETELTAWGITFRLSLWVVGFLIADKLLVQYYFRPKAYRAIKELREERERDEMFLWRLRKAEEINPALTGVGNLVRKSAFP